MKLVLALAAAAILAALAVVAFALANLQALAGARHDRLLARVERATGRTVTIGAVVPSWWPLGVRLRDVAITDDPGFGSRPFFTAAGVIVAVRAWPLVAGRIEAAGVVLDQPQVVLARDATGAWNVASLGERPRAKEERKRRRSHDGGHGFRLPFGWVIGVALSRVHDGTVLVEDGRGAERPPLVLHALQLRATDVRLGATAHLRLDAALFSANGADVHLDVRLPELGQADGEHTAFAAQLTVEGIDLAAVSALAARPQFAAGKLTRLAVDAEGTLERMRLTATLDADDPGLRVGRAALATVQPLAVRLRATRNGNAITIDEGRVSAAELVVGASGRGTVDPARAELTLDSLAGATMAVPWGEPPLRVGALAGHLVLDREGASLEPLRLELDGSSCELAGRVTGLDPVVVDGRVTGKPFGGTGRADVTLDASGALRAHVEADHVDVTAAMARFAPAVGDRVAGRAALTASLAGRVADGAIAPGSLAGSGTLSVADGRLRDVNLPDLVVKEVERIPFVPQLVSERVRERYGDLFASPDTVIEQVSMPFTLGHGRLTTDAATMTSPAYQIDGHGWIDSAQELHFAGEVLLSGTLSRTLRDDVRVAEVLSGPDGRVTLPFLVRGSLTHLSVEPDMKELRRVGLDALLGHEAAAPEADDQDGGKRERRKERLGDKVIERLQKLLHR